MRAAPEWAQFPRFPVTSGTIALAVLVSVGYWTQKLNAEPLFETVDIRNGELWRIVTSIFPHGNVLHLVFNAYWTWTFGTLVEEVFGSAALLGMILLFAVIGNGAEYAILSGGIGLSGVGYGLFGLLWVLTKRDRRFADVIDSNTVSLFVVWFFACIVLTITGIMPIANVAHGMGAVAGILIGFAITGPATPRRLATVALAGLTALVIVGSTIARPAINLSYDRGYDEGKRGYDELEAQHNQQALDWLRDAVRMQTRMANYWFNLGIAYERLNRPTDAAAAYQRASELEPNNSEYREAAAQPTTNR